MTGYPAATSYPTQRFRRANSDWRVICCLSVSRILNGTVLAEEGCEQTSLVRCGSGLLVPFWAPTGQAIGALGQ